jgi:hypothetical protein
MRIATSIYIPFPSFLFKILRTELNRPKVQKNSEQNAEEGNIQSWSNQKGARHERIAFFVAECCESMAAKR